MTKIRGRLETLKQFEKRCQKSKIRKERLEKELKEKQREELEERRKKL